MKTTYNEQGYKTETTNQSITVYFHEGNGWNFRVKTTSKATYVTRYHTNGHVNRDDRTVKINKVVNIGSWAAAAEYFS